jgi:Holliday junction resolvase RusA-like endonuclease
MSLLENLILKTQALKLKPESPAAKVLDDALEAVLLLEGPPTQPIDNFSEDVTTTIARSNAGRIRFLAHTWQTGPWRCLLLDLAPVPMGRPQLLSDPKTNTHRVTVDYHSRKMQEQIKFACHSLSLPPPPEPSRVFTAFDRHRTFLAWTAYSLPVSTLKGDLDNYAKNALDGLQRARMLRNDKTVASLTAVNCPMPEARRTLQDYLHDQILDHLKANPAHSPKTVAKALNFPVQRTERAFRALDQAIQQLRTDLVRDFLLKHPNASPKDISQTFHLALKHSQAILNDLRPKPHPAQPTALHQPALQHDSQKEVPCPDDYNPDLEPADMPLHSTHA